MQHLSQTRSLWKWITCWSCMSKRARTPQRISSRPKLVCDKFAENKKKMQLQRRKIGETSNSRKRSSPRKRSAPERDQT